MNRHVRTTPARTISEHLDPACPDLEARILGAVLRDGVGVIPLDTPLEPGLFSLEEHRQIWAAVANLACRNLPHGSASVAAEMRKTGQPESDSISLENMVRTAPGVETMQHELHVAYDVWSLRRIAKLARSTIDQALQPGQHGIDLLPPWEDLTKELRATPAGGDNLWVENLKAIATDLDYPDLHRCLQSGLEPWDQATGGFGPGEMVGVFGRPGTGKTSLAEQMALDIAQRTGQRVLVFSRDMGPRLFIERLACRDAGVPFAVFHRGLLTVEQKEALRESIEAMKKLLFVFEHPSRLTGEHLREMVRRHAAVGNLGLVILDHVQRLDLPGNPEALRIALTAASGQIRHSATNSRVPHLILAQANRESERESTRPSLRHIGEFDALAADSDTVCGLWHKKSPLSRTAAANGLARPLPVTFTFLKVRSGPPAERTMMFDGTMMTFRGLTYEELATT